MDIANFLDLKDVLFNELIGGIWLTVIIGLIAITFIAAKSKLGGEITLILLALWGTICFAAYQANLTIIWVLVVLVSAALFYQNVARIIRRG